MPATSPAPIQPLGPALQSGDQLNKLFGNPDWSSDNAITALGATLPTAYVLVAALSRFSVVAAGANGAALGPGFAGEIKVVFNDDGADDMTIYAAGGATIDGTAGNVGVTLTHAKRAIFICFAPGVWISAQLGVVSA